MNQVTDLFQLTEFGFICFLKIPKKHEIGRSSQQRDDYTRSYPGKPIDLLCRVDKFLKPRNKA